MVLLRSTTTAFWLNYVSGHDYMVVYICFKLRIFTFSSPLLKQGKDGKKELSGFKFLVGSF